MTTTQGTTDAPAGTLALDFDLQHQPEKVWRALTTPELLQQWLLPVIGFDLAQGTEFTFQTQSYPGWDGKVHCRIIESEPPRKLSYAWVAAGIDTVVTFTLVPTAAGTHLSVVQSGFSTEQKREFGGARYGWNMMVGKLAETLAKTA